MRWFPHELGSSKVKNQVESQMLPEKYRKAMRTIGRPPKSKPFKSNRLAMTSNRKAVMEDSMIQQRDNAIPFPFGNGSTDLSVTGVDIGGNTTYYPHPHTPKTYVPTPPSPTAGDIFKHRTTDISTITSKVDKLPPSHYLKCFSQFWWQNCQRAAWTLSWFFLGRGDMITGIFTGLTYRSPSGRHICHPM